MFKNYVKITWRSLLKDKRFILLNLLGLSTELACVLLIFSWVNEELQTAFNDVYTIAGVYISPPANATNQFGLLIPFELYAAKNAGGMGDITFWGSNMVSSYIKLKPGTNTVAFDKKIKNFSVAKIKSLYPDESEMKQYEGTLFTGRFSNAYLHNYFVDGKLSGGRIEWFFL